MRDCLSSRLAKKSALGTAAVSSFAIRNDPDVFRHLRDDTCTSGRHLQVCANVSQAERPAPVVCAARVTTTANARQRLAALGYASAFWRKAGGWRSFSLWRKLLLTDDMTTGLKLANVQLFREVFLPNPIALFSHLLPGRRRLMGNLLCKDCADPCPASYSHTRSCGIVSGPGSCSPTSSSPPVPSDAIPLHSSYSTVSSCSSDKHDPLSAPSAPVCYSPGDRQLNIETQPCCNNIEGVCGSPSDDNSARSGYRTVRFCLSGKDIEVFELRSLTSCKDRIGSLYANNMEGCAVCLPDDSPGNCWLPYYQDAGGRCVPYLQDGNGLYRQFSPDSSGIRLIVETSATPYVIDPEANYDGIAFGTGISDSRFEGGFTAGGGIIVGVILLLLLLLCCGAAVCFKKCCGGKSNVQHANKTLSSK